MPVTKVSSTQTKNEGLPKILKITFNNGTGVRSTAPVGSTALIPGATGDTSYTAPADTDVDILFSMTVMINISAGICTVGLAINGVTQTQRLYCDYVGGWMNYTCTYKIPVDAGQTITIGIGWTQSSAVGTITNATADGGFPNVITGLVIPRPS
jgi:hypothetical protein